MKKHAVIRLEHEVGIGPADIDAYARHGSPDRFRAAVPVPGAQRLCVIACETLSAMFRARNP
jgi:hypothetical protein